MRRWASRLPAHAESARRIGGPATRRRRRRRQGRAAGRHDACRATGVRPGAVPVERQPLFVFRRPPARDGSLGGELADALPGPAFPIRVRLLDRSEPANAACRVRLHEPRRKRPQPANSARERQVVRAGPERAPRLVEITEPLNRHVSCPRCRIARGGPRRRPGQSAEGCPSSCGTASTASRSGPGHPRPRWSGPRDRRT